MSPGEGPPVQWSGRRREEEKEEEAGGGCEWAEKGLKEALNSTSPPRDPLLPLVEGAGVRERGRSRESAVNSDVDRGWTRLRRMRELATEDGEERRRMRKVEAKGEEWQWAWEDSDAGEEGGRGEPRGR
jgi:hypothetical protein